VEILFLCSDRFVAVFVYEIRGDCRSCQSTDVDALLAHQNPGQRTALEDVVARRQKERTLNKETAEKEAEGAVTVN
jgi:hypothetical protein